MSAARRRGFEFGGAIVPPGRTATRELPIPSLVTGTHLSLPVRVSHGREEGPTVWISAALHGDEIAGARQSLGWEHPPFEIPAEIRADTVNTAQTDRPGAVAESH